VERIEKTVPYDYENERGQDWIRRLEEQKKKGVKKNTKQKREPGASTGKIAELKKIDPAEKKVRSVASENSGEQKPKKRFNRDKNRNRGNRTPNNDKQ